MTRIRTIRRFPVFATARVMALPDMFSMRFQIRFGRDIRFWTMAIAAGLGIAAIGAYVIAVNVILLGGESIRRNQEAIQLAERERVAFENLVAQQQSPAWLEEESRANGLVEIKAVRYITSDQSVALSR